MKAVTSISWVASWRDQGVPGGGVEVGPEIMGTPEHDDRDPLGVSSEELRAVIEEYGTHKAKSIRRD